MVIFLEFFIDNDNPTMDAESISMKVATVSRPPMIEDFIFICFKLIHGNPIRGPHI